MALVFFLTEPLATDSNWLYAYVDEDFSIDSSLLRSFCRRLSNRNTSVDNNNLAPFDKESKSPLINFSHLLGYT